MTQPSSRAARQVGIAAHLWDAYEELARQVGCAPEALVHQALFMFARLNGVDPAAHAGAAARSTRPLPTVREEVTAVATPGAADGSGRAQPGAPQAEEEEGGLFLMLDGGEPVRVRKDRFVIGRGKHCDLVVNSSKISREHVLVVRDPEGYFIEDLNSSNGTTLGGQRIQRRRIEDGDEYVLCDRRLRAVFG